MKQKIASESMKVDDDLASDITSIMNENEKTMNPFMKLFWEQQKKEATVKCMRYHPMNIRFVLV